MPELASLRVAVMEEGNKFLGHRIIPISALNSGKDRGPSLLFQDLYQDPVHRWQLQEGSPIMLSARESEAGIAPLQETDRG